MIHTTYLTQLKGLVTQATLGGIILLTLYSSAIAQTDRVHFGFIYPISTHGNHAPADTNNFSFHVLAGVSAEERGLAFAGISNVIRHNATGLTFAGIANHVGDNVSGLAFAGVSNTYKSGKGLQFAGICNIAADSVQGSQFSGIVNKADNVNGSQWTGFSNVARNIVGSQVAGFANTATSMKGSQLAGFSNVTVADISGSQVSGFVNHAKNVSGSQLAGFINIAKKVRGAQIAGFINIADSSDHPIGLINIIKNGEKSIGITVDETQTALLALRSGGKVLYGILGLGYNLRNEDEVYALEAGLGAKFFRGKVFRLKTEAAVQTLESFEQGEYFKSSFRLLPSLRAGKSFELVGGPSFNVVNTNTTEGKTLVDHYQWRHNNRYNSGMTGIYFGYAIGINIQF